MIPASHPATRIPPKRGITATTSPAAISTTPMMCIASPALPGSRSLNWVERYRVQSSVSTFANLSRPNRIGATVNAIRMTRNACATGSRLSVSEVGTRTGRSEAARVLMCESFRVAGARCAGSTRVRRVVGASYEFEQAGVILGAGRAARQVRPHAGHGEVGIRPADLELDESIELLEAFFARDLRSIGTEQCTQVWIRHPRLLTRRNRVLRYGHAACGGHREGSCKAHRAWC